MFSSVVSDGNGWLVVWEDHRNDPPEQLQGDIYGARVSPDGVSLDPEGFPISVTDKFAVRPDVSHNGESALVVWTGRAGATHAYAARVARDGSVLDPDATQLSFGAGGWVNTNNLSTRPIQVDFDGSDWLVMWPHGQPGDQSRYAALVGRDGRMLQLGPIEVPNGHLPFNLSHDGSSWMYVTTADHTITGRRIARDLTLLDEESLLIHVPPNRMFSPGIACSATSSRKHRGFSSAQ